MLLPLLGGGPVPWFLNGEDLQDEQACLGDTWAPAGKVTRHPGALAGTNSSVLGVA